MKKITCVICGKDFDETEYCLSDDICLSCEKRYYDDQMYNDMDIEEEGY